MPTSAVGDAEGAILGSFPRAVYACTCIYIPVSVFLNRRPLEIAEGNPAKFRLNYGELETRKQFIRDTRSVVKVCPLSLFLLHVFVCV